MINKVLRLVMALPGFLFLVIGMQWLIVPADAGKGLGMTLLQGTGLSTQIGDLGAFFLTLAVCIFTGITTLRRHWFYPAVMLLGFAAFARIVAWAVHDAALAVPMIAFEVIVSCLLWFGSARICNAEKI